jgi:chromosomal replication initiator protein
MNTLSEIWEIALDYLKGELSPIVFNQYMKPIEPVYHNNGTFVLKFPEEYQRLCVKNQYQILVAKALSYATGSPGVNLKLVLDASEYEEAAFASADGYAPVQNYWRMSFNPKYTFDTFIEGSNNRLALAAAQAVAKAPAKKYNPLFIYGASGLGKTHLMQAIAQSILSDNPRCKVVFISSEKFTNDFIETIRNKTNFEFRKKYRSADVLLVDDIQFVAGKEQTQEEFFHTFNDLYNAGKQIILTSDKSPKDIQNLESRLRSRFECGLECDISPPNFETRVAILKKKAEYEQISLSDKIYEFVAENTGSNVRELEGILLKIKVFTETENGAVSDEQLMEYLKKSLSTAEKRISPETVIQAAAKYYSISYPDMLSSKRTMNIAKARQVAMYMIREMTDLSLPAIGEALGGRNHSTVIHACTKIKEEEEASPVMHGEIAQITNLIKDINNR